jgi:hypothetical protein
MIPDFGKAIKTIIAILVIVFVILIAWLVMTNIAQRKEIKRGKSNTSYLLSSVEQWKNINGNYVATAKQQVFTIKQLKHSTNVEINKLLADNKSLGNKLRKTEALIGIDSELSIDTVVQTVIHFVNDTTFIEIDSLQIESLRIVRNKIVGDDLAKYSIRYNPVLTVVIEDYKEGRWKIRNIWSWRPKLYKIDVMSSDSILKPRNVTYLKID